MNRHHLVLEDFGGQRLFNNYLKRLCRAPRLFALTEVIIWHLTQLFLVQFFMTILDLANIEGRHFVVLNRAAHTKEIEKKKRNLQQNDYAQSSFLLSLELPLLEVSNPLKLFSLPPLPFVSLLTLLVEGGRSGGSARILVHK